MSYFKLYSDVFLIRGVKGAVIQDTARRRAFALDSEYSAVLYDTENGASLEEAGVRSGLTYDRVREIVEEISSAELGAILDANVYVEKIDTSPKWKDDLVFRSPPRIDRVFVQFGGACDLGCSYCRGGDRALSVSCWQCTPTPDIPIDQLEDAIKELAQLAPREIIISCPPVVDIPSLRRIIQTSTKAAPSVTVASDSSIPIDQLGLNEDHLGFLFKLDIKSHPISEVQNWAAKIPSNSIVQLILEDVDDPVEPYVSLLEGLGLKVAMAEVLELGEGTVADRVLDQPCDTREFSYRVNHHTCLSTSLTIRSDGAIFQCPRLSSLELADGFDLVTALRSERFDKLSQMSMNKIAPCQSCEMRYLCSDCRYLEMATGASAEECVRCHRVS